MTTSPVYLGIDLGTTNSTAAAFDGAQLTPVRNAQGTTLTPSVVRIDARGNVTIGARARRFLETDPGNTHGEFKRLMGTSHTLAFAARGATKKPEELSAEVLKSIRADARDQLGFVPEAAVISVPALFELAQTAATSEAARLAGFTRVEMIQEPVASALAAGWSSDRGDESWLVYDLGGGTFDVTLLSTREGLLRVVGHDGDNFLGGRDFDGRIVDWVLDEVRRAHGVAVDRADPAHRGALRKLRHAAEEAKIELTRSPEAPIVQPELFEVNGASIDVDVLLERGVLEGLVGPLVDRSIAVCKRLLAAHGQPRLGRIVLVGGPTAMPLLRARVAEALGAPFRDGLDPMTLVAQGAALYAATSQIDARPRAAAPAAQGPRVWLQHPAMTPDVTPFVVGKFVDASAAAVERVVVRRADGGWVSAPEALDADGAFAIPVNVVPRKPNVFHVDAVTKSGETVAAHPPTFTIVHGVTIGDPPLSRSVGVALASNAVRVYFERGSPLPMRRTFTLRTVETVSREVDGFALRVPIVQGEFPLAHLCRLVGTLEIASHEIKASLPAGSAIDLTLEVDRGGRLAASARVAALDQVFDRVAHLVAPQVPVEELQARAEALRERARTLQSDAVKRGVGAAVIAKLGDLDETFGDIARDVELAKSGDADATEKTRRALLEVDATLAGAESELAWPAMEESITKTKAWAVSWLSAYGDEGERKVLSDTLVTLEKARIARDAQEVDRQIRIVRRLGWAAYCRAPGAWEEQFEWAATNVAEATDVVRATALVKEGERAMSRKDRAALERATRELLGLMPPDTENRRLGHSSGVR